MGTSTYDELFHSENQHKENVYLSFENECLEAKKNVAKAKTNINSGAYDDHSTFMVYGKLNSANKQQKSADILAKNLYRSPYFAHIELQLFEDETYHFFLSDCEALDESMQIGNDDQLIPFKRDPKKPISESLHKCYQQKNGAAVICNIPEGKQLIYQPKLICDVQIDNRTLLSVTPYYPEQKYFCVDIDELLDKKLQENRTNAALKNIIATLQREQFQIISADTSVSFVVQGCAGSGKSQCLLHRLFYLREELSQKGWKNVLLLTPTKLFRHYSANLIRRYGLSQINDCSIAELYRTLLNNYDSHFRNRQYQFELSEEYLPDEYLREIYEPKIIERIDAEIDNAIRKYVQFGCNALNINTPNTLDEKFISSLIDRLNVEISNYEARETVLKRKPEYLEKRVQYEHLQNQLEKAKSSQTRAIAMGEQLQKKQKEFSDLLQSCQEAENERTMWANQQKQRIIVARDELIHIANEMDKHPTVSMPAHYAHQLCILRNLTSGDMFTADKEYLAFLNDYCDSEKHALQAVTKKQKPETYAEKLKGRLQENSERQNALAIEINDLSRHVDDCAKWLHTKVAELDGTKSQIILHRSELEKSKHFLLHIESAIFESEVWNVLSVIKKKYGIKTIQIDFQEDSHKRETRILYKADLLFYVKIYAKIHLNKELPHYQMICVDEGQDLHKADFDILHALFPDAVFNVFGDVAQVLHTSCGIENWQKETGIQQVYKLETNYRNTASIVNYCNTALNSNMKYIGKVNIQQNPQVFSDKITLKSVAAVSDIVIIVKDNQSFKEFCIAIGKSTDDFEYLDTNAEESTEAKPMCYSVFAAKGLEFTSVLVYSRSMNLNQKIVACTRAMERLCYYE